MLEIRVALAALRLPANVPGDFFVDSSCIDCDACRQIAPSVFREAGEQSAVVRQPDSPEELLAAQKALIACPTASIGSVAKHDMRAALAAFPAPVAENVYFCGYTSESSFGAFSYLIVRAQSPEARAQSRQDPSGLGAPGSGLFANVMIDSPRFAAPLVKNVEALGGIKMLLLTHRDDVADHEKFHRKFGSRRVLHANDVTRGSAEVEWQPEGSDPITIHNELVMIPVPGHTRGHSVYLYRDRFLFSGDHLAWDERRQRLYAFREACWYSWSEQIKSMEKLLDYRFEWVLPGHGRPVHLPAGEMHDELVKCVAWMKRAKQRPAAAWP